MIVLDSNIKFETSKINLEINSLKNICQREAALKTFIREKTKTQIGLSDVEKQNILMEKASILLLKRPFIIQRACKLLNPDIYTGITNLRKLSRNLKKMVKIMTAARLRYTNRPLTSLQWFEKGDREPIQAYVELNKENINLLKLTTKQNKLLVNPITSVSISEKYIVAAQKLLYRNARLKRYMYPRGLYAYKRSGPQRLLTDKLPAFVENKYFVLKNFYRKRFGQLPPDQQQRQKILAHFYLKFSRYTLFFNAKKRRDITSNFFSYDRKLLKLYAHRVEKFIYKRYPYHTQKFKTKFYFPDYSNYRFLFKNQIKAQHTFRWLYRLSYKQLVKMYKKTIFYSKRRFEFVFLKYLELRLDTALYRLNIAFSLKQARQWVKRGLFLVNNKTITWPKYQINVGDIVRPILLIRSHHWPDQSWTIDFGQIYNSTRLFWRPIQTGQYPDHFIINERIPAGLVVLNPNPHRVFHTRPVSIQFLTLSLLKYS